jgi:hypothetical protein
MSETEIKKSKQILSGYFQGAKLNCSKKIKKHTPSNEGTEKVSSFSN